MMRSTWKRALSTILTVCMIASLLVVPAAAEKTPETKTETITEVHNVTTDELTDPDGFFKFTCKTDPTDGLKTADPAVTQTVSGESLTLSKYFSMMTSDAVFEFEAPAAGTLTIVARQVPDQIKDPKLQNNGGTVGFSKTVAMSKDDITTVEIPGAGHVKTKRSNNCAIFYVAFSYEKVTVGPTVELDIAEKEVEVGKTQTLTPTVTPEGTEVTWTSSDDSGKISVDNGVVTVAADAVAGTTATITASVTANGMTDTATCTITVAAAADHEHTFNGTETVIKEANCLEDGTKEVACSHEGCDATQIVTIEALGHAWPEQAEVVEDSTCAKKGYKIKTCTREGCGVVDEATREVIDFKPHAEYGEDGLCTACKSIDLSWPGLKICVWAGTGADDKTGVDWNGNAVDFVTVAGENPKNTKGTALYCQRELPNAFYMSSSGSFTMNPTTSGTVLMYMENPTDGLKIAMTPTGGTASEATPSATDHILTQHVEAGEVVVTRNGSSSRSIFLLAFMPDKGATPVETKADKAVGDLITALTPSEGGGEAPTAESISFTDNLSAAVSDTESDLADNSEYLKGIVKTALEAELTKAGVTDITVTVNTATYAAPAAQMLAVGEPVDAGSITYTATLTDTDGKTAGIGGVVTLTEPEAAPVDDNVTGVVTMAPVGVVTDGTDESATLAPGYSVTGTPDGTTKTTDVTITANKVVKHARNEGDHAEGFWLGFGMQNNAKSAYVWKYAKTAGDTPAAVGSVANRYVDVGADEHYNTVYVELDKDLTEDGKFIMTQCDADGNVLWTYNVTVSPMPTLVQDYNITKATVTEGGSFTYAVDGTEGNDPGKAQNGATVTVTPAAADKYKVGTVTVNDEATEVTDNGDGTYSFTMPAKAVEVTVTFVEKKLDVTVTQPTGLKFDNTAKELTVTVKDETGAAVNDATKTVTVTEYKKIGSETAEASAPTEIKDAGTYTVTVTAAKTGYTDGTKSVTFTVAKADAPTLTIHADHNSVKADAANGTSQVVIDVDGTLPGTDTDGEIVLTATPALDASKLVKASDANKWTATFEDATQDYVFVGKYEGDDNHTGAQTAELTVHVTAHGEAQKSAINFKAMDSTAYDNGYKTDVWTNKPAWNAFHENLVISSAGKVTGTLKYVEGFTGFHGSDPAAQEGWYLPYMIAVPNGWKDSGKTAALTAYMGEGGTADKVMNVTGANLDQAGDGKYYITMLTKCNPGSAPKLKIDWDKDSDTDWTESVDYTMDLSGLTFEGKDASDKFVFANLTTEQVSTAKTVTAKKVGYQTYEVTINAGELTAHKRTGVDPADTEDAFWVGVGIPKFDMEQNSLFVSKDNGTSWTHIGANESGEHYMTYTSLTPGEDLTAGATKTLLYKVTADSASGADENGAISAQYTVTFGATKLVYPDYKINKTEVTTAGCDFGVADTAKAGFTVEITPNPAEGYEVDTVTVDGETVTATAGVYKFTMPAKDVTVAVTFKEKTAETRTLTFAIDEGATVTFTAPADAELTAEKTLTVEKATDVKFTVAVTDDTKELKEVKVGETALIAAEGVYTVAGAADAADATVTVTLQAKATPVEPMWPDLQYKVTDTLGADGTSIAGGTVVETVEGIKLTYGTGTYAKQTSASAGNEGVLVTASGMEAMVKGSDAPNASGNVPTTGTFYKFEASKNGELMIAYAAFSGKNVVISEQEAGATTATLVPNVGGQMSDNANKGETINVKAGNTYYIYAGSSKVCLYGFSFTPASETAPVVNINTPANDGKLMQGKTLQLTAEVTPTDATLAWESDTPAVATVDNNGLVTAVAPGTAVITLTATKNGETGTDTVTITVTEEGAFVLDTSADLPGDTGITETRKAGTGDYFTIIPKLDSQGVAKTKTKASSKTFDDGYSGTQRLEIGDKFDAAKKLPAVGFTTSGAATVKVWWLPNSDNREIGIFKAADGSQVAATTEQALGSACLTSELALTDAGEYLLGAIGGNVYIFKIQVIDKEGAKPITKVEIDTPAVTELEVGEELTLTATKTPTAATETLVWSSSDATKATVDANGKVTAVAPGTVTITVTAEGTDPVVSDTIDLTIKAKTVITDGTEYVFDPTTLTAAADGEAITDVEMPVPYTATDLVKKVSSTTGKVYAAQTTSATAGSLNVTVPEGKTGTLVIETASTSSTNTTKFELVDGTGTAINNVEGVYQVTGSGDNKITVTWKDLPAGTYSFKPAAGSEKQARVYKATITFKTPGAPEPEKVTVTYEWAFDEAPATVPTAPAAVEIDKGGKVTTLPTAETIEGYTFAGWFVGETAFTTDTVVNESITVTGKYTKNAAPVVNKDALNDAIAAAELTLSKATVAENGDEVLTTDNWITAADKTAVETAIAAAKAVANKTDATQDEVDAAKTALDTALAGKFQKGSKEVSKADLEAAIDAAEKASAAITVAEDAADVTKGTKFVKQADKDAYDDKIAEAQAVIDALGDKTDEQLTAEDKKAIEDALHALNAATHAFELAQDEGTKSSGGYRPSGGGSSVGTGTTTTTTKPDGTKVVTETKRDGTVVVTQTKPDGTKVVTTTDKDGESTTTVTVPSNVDKTTVSVPVTDANTGMVPVIVKPDGTEEIIRDSSVEDGEVVFPMTESGTIKIVNNAKHFVDIDDHWAEDEVNFVSARDLFNGVDATHFAPNATMTRGMMATVLFRLNGENKSDKAVDFSDVQAGTWYSDAVDWAAEAGVITGYTDGTFAPNKSVTREELVVMVYRYAGAPKADAADMTGFTDVDKVADWASAAMNWAVKNGIINGRDNGALDPKGNATRAEVAAVLQRFVKLANQ